MTLSRIDWTDETYNPMPGCFGPGGTWDKPNRCYYCYAKEMYRRDRESFVPTWLPERLDKIPRRGRPRRIFINSMGDLFGSWVSNKRIRHVLDVAKLCPQHTFIFLTKHPARLPHFNPWPDNCWVGASAVDQTMADEAERELSLVLAPVRFMSCEPLLEAVRLPRYSLDWLIIGACTGKYAKQPEREWVEDLIRDGRRGGAKIWLKDNLFWDGPRLQELPEREGAGKQKEVWR